MAAVLLATSCSKDEDNNDAVKPDTTKQANTETEQQGVPFTIKVVTGKKLSKIGYEDKGATVQPSFSETDEGNLVLDIYNLSTKDAYGSLFLTDYTNGIFNGTLLTAPQDGEKVGAKIVKTGGSNSDFSTESLTDLMEKCTHRFEGSFTYGSENTVTLIDQNAYFEIFMSPLQNELSVKIDNFAEPYPLNNEGKIWIRVSAGISFETNFYSKTTPEAGTIYSIDRSGYVDLGLSDGTLWADKNVGASTYDGAGNYYTFAEAQQLTDITLPTSGETDNSDFELLKTQCKWVYQNGGFYVFKSQQNADKGQSSTSLGMYSTVFDPYIFLPCAGEIRDGETAVTYADTYGYYWSATEKDNSNAYCLAINYSDMMDWITISSKLNNYKLDKFTIRSVLKKSKD